MSGLATDMLLANTHLVSVSADRDPECAGETEISKLEDSIPVDEQVLWFQISVQHAMCMAERDSLHK